MKCPDYNNDIPEKYNFVDFVGIGFKNQLSKEKEVICIIN